MHWWQESIFVKRGPSPRGFLLPFRFAELLEVPGLRDRNLVALLGGLPRLPAERATLVLPVVLLLISPAGGSWQPFPFLSAGLGHLPMGLL
jgi:hypothetical protein